MCKFDRSGEWTSLRTLGELRIKSAELVCTESRSKISLKYVSVQRNPHFIVYNAVLPMVVVVGLSVLPTLTTHDRKA